MLADWSIECSGEDPVLVVPWSSETPSESSGEPSPHTSGDQASEKHRTLPPASHFVDLRENPYDLDQIPEAELHPPLMQALRALNAPRSPVFTAKCDAWPLAADELQTLRLELEATALDAPAGFASYIDLLWRDRTIFASFHQHEQILHRIARHASALDYPAAALDCVLRPAMIDFAGAQEGFAISVYVKALGHTPAAASQNWGKALESVVALLRGKDMALA